MGAECAVRSDRVCGSPWARAAPAPAPVAMAAITTAPRTPRWRFCDTRRDAWQPPLGGWIGRRAITGAWRVICGGVRAGAKTVDLRTVAGAPGSSTTPHDQRLMCGLIWVMWPDLGSSAVANLAGRTPPRDAWVRGGTARTHGRIDDGPRGSARRRPVRSPG